MSYDGLTTTTHEFVGAAGGEAATSTTTNDRFGRLALVDELLSTAPTWATTKYVYGPDDAVRKITQPSDLAVPAVVTELTHDFAGRRIEIKRGDRRWTYGYDKNGNLTSEKTPEATTCSQQPTCQVNYTTTTAYDDLDRPVSRLNAHRNLSSADLTLFGADRENMQWDVGGNMVGRRRGWNAYAPGGTNQATLSTRESAISYGFTRNVATVFQAAGNNLTRSHLRSWHPNGQVRTVYHSDEVGGGNHTSVTQFLDARGLPMSLSIQAQPQGTASVAVQTRNVAGLVTKRRTDQSGPMTFIESIWTYDALGRVSDQTVQKGPGPVQVARQSLVYAGNDDVTSMDHWLGSSNQKHFNYTFDRRHQLTGVSETSSPSAFAASYTFGPAGRFKTASESATALPGSNVLPRNVEYQYDGNDPEQVTALINVGNTTPFATYQYDDSGNQSLRCNGPLIAGQCAAESLEMLYDGKDQLRRATKTNASGQTVSSEEYWYDGNGQRMAVLKRDAAGSKTELILFNVDEEVHYDGAGALQYVDSYITLGGTPVAKIKRTGNTTTVWEYQFHGLANNALAAVDRDTGTINASFVYAPFGEVIEATDGGGPTNGIDKHRHRMNDKYVDEISDLAYYGARYYDRTSMTWTLSDPLYRFVPDLSMHEPRRQLLYAMSLNNPLRYLDPDGLDGVPGGDGSTGPFLPDYGTGANSPLSEHDKLKVAECQRTHGAAPGCGIGSRNDPKGRSRDSLGQGSAKGARPAKSPSLLSRAFSVAKVVHGAYKLLKFGCALGAGAACEVVAPVENALKDAAGWLADLVGVGAQARKPDLAIIDRIASAVGGLNDEQRDLLHREINKAGSFR